jgi:CBS domain containing-hemolysin-like protein
MAAALVVVACIALNAALAALEIAFVSARRLTSVRTRSLAMFASGTSYGARRPSGAFRDLGGPTLVSLLCGAVGDAGAQEFVSPFLQQRLGLGEASGTVLAIAIVAISLTFVVPYDQQISSGGSNSCGSCGTTRI